MLSHFKEFRRRIKTIILKFDKDKLSRSKLGRFLFVLSTQMFEKVEGSRRKALRGRKKITPEAGKKKILKKGEDEKNRT